MKSMGVREGPGRVRAALPGRRSSSVPYLVLLLALLLTVAAAYYIAVTDQAKGRLRFDNLVQQSNDRITTRLNAYISALRGVGGLLAAAPNLDRDGFHVYVDRLRLSANYPGIQGIGFSRRLDPADRAAFVASVRRQGIPAFRLWPERERDEYHAILYLEPLDKRNQAALGFDMFSEPVRRAAMERARDTGRAAASGKVTLVQEIDEQKQAGFLIYLPIYRGGALPATVAERRARLVGFAYCPFRADDLFENIVGTQTDPPLAFRLYNGATPTPDHLLYRSDRKRAYTDYRPSFTAQASLPIGGRTWSVAYATLPAFERTGVHFAPTALITGLVISLVLFRITQAQVVARRAEAESAAELRVFLRDVLASVTEGKLRLCDSAADLPPRLAPEHPPIILSSSSLRSVRQCVREVAVAQGQDTERWQNLLTAVGEASMNAVVHAGGGQAQVAAGEDGLVQVWVEDQGTGIDVRRLPRATLERGFSTGGSLGHGFWLILQTVDRVWLLTGLTGTTVVLEQGRTPPEPGWLAIK